MCIRDRHSIIVDRAAIRHKTQALLELFDGMFRSRVTPDTPVVQLPPDEKQLIEILKAISAQPRVLILDESTASLDRRQVQRLFELVAAWKQAGQAIIFISHRMDEIFRLADRYVVLRNGATVGTGAMQDVSAQDIVHMMVQDASAEQVSHRTRHSIQERARRPVVLDIKNLYAEGLHGISLQLHRGELLGLGGLRGQGQQQLLQAMFGEIPYTCLLFTSRCV